MTKAFTLMELMVVLALVAVMAAVIVPEMKGSFEESLLRSSARKLAEVSSLAYSRAVSLNQIHRLRFNPTTGQYLIERQVGDGDEYSDFEPITDVAECEGRIDSRISLNLSKFDPDSDSTSDDTLSSSSSSPDTIAFFPDGTAEACELLLRDRAGFQLILRLSPNTARIHVVDKPTEGSNP